MYRTKKELLLKSKEAKGKTFGEIDQYNRLSNNSNKGNLGQVIEESFFEYNLNSSSKPDFEELGVELKVTPFKLNKNGSYSAKERLVLNIIDYNNEHKLTFENSSFWKKNRSLLLMFYLHDFEIVKREMKIYETLLFEYPKDDLEIIRKDYEIIHKKIKDGKAHILSESDTLYLAACTKGATSASSYRTQPFSKVMAKQRAFSLKQSYMTAILREYVFGRRKNERVIKDINQLKGLSFEQYIKQQLHPYKNINVDSLYKRFQVSDDAKNRRASLISKMLSVENLSSSDEFIKSGLKFKTVLVNKKNRIRENMSFPHFDFLNLVQEKWEEANIRDLFYTTRFVFAVFKESSEGVEAFDRIIFWSMPESIIENDVKSVWNKTREVLLSGEIVHSIKQVMNNRQVYINNFPSSKFNPIVHVRPHAKNRLDILPLPINDKLTGKESYTKQCFWLHRDFILKIVKEG